MTTASIFDYLPFVPQRYFFLNLFPLQSVIQVDGRARNWGVPASIARSSDLPLRFSEESRDLGL